LVVVKTWARVGEVLGVVEVSAALVVGAPMVSLTLSPTVALSRPRCQKPQRRT